MRWFEHAIFWQVYPLGFTGAPVRPSGDDERQLTHRLRHLGNWLDYVQQLGCNGLLLGPVFTSMSHGYDTTDHYAIDPRLGDEADFDALVAGCRERGINLVLDGVFNHVGIEHPLYQQALREGPDSDAAKLFRIDWQHEPPRAEVFEGHGDLVALNHDEPAVADWVADVMLHWLRKGIMGWRLDAAYAVRADFWKPALDKVHAEFGEAWVMGEVIHGDYAGIVRESGMDSVTEYELWKAVWSSLKDENFFELDWALKRHDALLDTFVPQTFVGNHDVTRIASQVGQEKAALAQVVLFTVAGIPSIYEGDEQGFEAVKRDVLGGDDDVRPTFPATPEELAPWGEPVLRRHQELVAMRRQHPWLVRARVETEHLRNGYLQYRAVGEQGEWLRVVLTVEDGVHATVDGPDGRVFAC